MFLEKFNKMKIFLLSLIIVVSFSSIATAATVTIGQNTIPNFVNAQCYILGTSNVPTRTSISGPDNGYIAPGDLCVIKNTSNSTYWSVTYPTSTGTKTAYVNKAAILNTSNYSKLIKINANNTVYKKSNMSSVFGTVYTTDTIYMLSPITNGKAQILYNVSGGYKIGWIYASTPSNNYKTMSSVIYGNPSISSRLTCGFDGYVRTYGRHEGIDFAYGSGKPIYSLIRGKVINVVYGSSSYLSTIAIYDSVTNKTVIYLHAAPSVKIGDTVSVGTKLGYEDKRGASAVHTHIEMRLGYRTHAAISSNSTLENPTPISFWNSKGYIIK